jgi:hypothetical protein
MRIFTECPRLKRVVLGRTVAETGLRRYSRNVSTGMTVTDTMTTNWHTRDLT